MTQAITMTILTHPLQVLLMGMLVLRGVQVTISVVREAGRVPRPATGHPGLQAA